MTTTSTKARLVLIRPFPNVVTCLRPVGEGGPTILRTTSFSTAGTSLASPYIAVLASGAVRLTFMPSGLAASGPTVPVGAGPAGMPVRGAEA